MDVTVHEGGESDLTGRGVVDQQASRPLTFDFLGRVFGFLARPGDERLALAAGADAHEPGVFALDDFRLEALRAQRGGIRRGLADAGVGKGAGEFGSAGDTDAVPRAVRDRDHRDS